MAFRPKLIEERVSSCMRRPSKQQITVFCASEFILLPSSWLISSINVSEPVSQPCRPTFLNDSFFFHTPASPSLWQGLILISVHKGLWPHTDSYCWWGICIMCVSAHKVLNGRSGYLHQCSVEIVGDVRHWALCILCHHPLLFFFLPKLCACCSVHQWLPSFLWHSKLLYYIIAMLFSIVIVTVKLSIVISAPILPILLMLVARYKLCHILCCI